MAGDGVLSWINTKKFNFKLFVAYRIAEILEGSKPTQWRHVPGKLNPADDASRWLEYAEELTSDHRWLGGSAFLYQDQITWPVQHIPPYPAGDDPEVKRKPKIVTTIAATKPSETVIGPILNRTNHRQVV